MVKLTINGLPVVVEDGTTIMEAAKAAGIMIPHLCYLKGINDIGACRICSVEVEGELSLVPSCNTKVREGMKVTTNSARVRSACRTNLMLIMNCPVGALRERKDATKVMDAIDNPEITTVVQIAPAVRTAWGEALGLSPDIAIVNQLAGALKQMGFDYVFDTSFTADLTIMEEGSEFLARLEKGDMEKYPMFTSCCPAWVRFLKSRYPELVPQLSSAKNPSTGAFGFVRADKDYTGEDRPWQEATYTLAGKKIKVAVTSGLRNADKLCQALLRGQVKYDFVEIMACPTGCSGGGGQPFHIDDVERGATRGQILRNIDEKMPVRFSHENKDVQKLYKDMLGAPLSELSEELLHTDHLAWHMPDEPSAPAPEK